MLEEPIGQGAKHYGPVHDTILFYSKTSDISWNLQYTELDENYVEKFYRYTDEKGRRYKLDNLLGPGGATKGNPVYEFLGVTRAWRYSKERMQELYEKGRVIQTKPGTVPMYKRYLDESKGVPLQTMWSDISMIRGWSGEKLDYPTQKPEALLERIIQASSNEGDLVADFFCGSGTTMAVAERLNRRWIGCNLDKVGIQVSRNRLVNQGAKPFLLENIGNYQRHMIYLSGSRINEMQRIILKLYEAFPRSDRPDLGNRGEELVYVGYPDRPVTAKKAIELAEDAQILDGTGYKTLVILAWDYDYNFTTELESRKKALKDKLKTEIKTLTIPPEIYNYLKKAKNEEDLEGLKDKILFHEKPYFRIGTPKVQDMGDGQVVITLSIDRYVLMDFPINEEKQKAELRKVIKDNFAALIDYWAVDWDYDGKTFKSQWQAIRGNGKRSSTVVTVATSPELPEGRRAIAVRLVDVFGNDASDAIEVK
jgi:adenine-specific DNA-methyltransferase